MQHIVAPFAGAWIEIVQRKKPDGESWSLPLRERGLKLIIHLKKKGTYKSLPLRERGLKFKRCYWNKSIPRRSLCGSVD